MRLIVVFLLLAVVASAGTVSPLEPIYSIAPMGGGLYGYDFTLTNVGLPAGTGVGWLMFGVTLSDTGWNGIGEPPDGYCVGQFGRKEGGMWYEEDFTLTSTVPSPWAEFGLSGGSFNGPNFGPPFSYWTPTVGESISWSGVSHRDLTQEGVKFAYLLSNDPYLRVQDGVAATPEPANFALIGLGLAFVALLRRRRA